MKTSCCHELSPWSQRVALESKIHRVGRPQASPPRKGCQVYVQRPGLFRHWNMMSDRAEFWLSEHFLLSVNGNCLRFIQQQEQRWEKDIGSKAYSTLNIYSIFSYLRRHTKNCIPWARILTLKSPRLGDFICRTWLSYNTQDHSMDQRDGSEFKSHWSYRRLGFQSKHPHGSSQ